MLDQVKYRHPIWYPDAAAAAETQMSAFMRHFAERLDKDIPSYEVLHRFSFVHFRGFWRVFLDWSNCGFSGDPRTVCTSNDIESAVFFPDLKLNYVQILLSETICSNHQPAIISCRAEGTTERLTRADLRMRVTAAALGFRDLGIGPESRIAMVSFNDANAAIAALAVGALGGAIAMSAPEMGAAASIARFAAVEPQILLCHSRTPHTGGDEQLQQKLVEIIQGLPSLRTVVVLDQAPEFDGLPLPGYALSDLITAYRGIPFDWPSLPFNHPLFILFSSGTTGTPKGIVHGAGGTLLEHLKEHRLHCDLRPGDRMFFQTSTAWMMWPWALTALASGVELVLYDGGVTAADTLWKIVAEEGVSVFGTGPAYLQMGDRAGLIPHETLDFSALRAVLSTGSILYEQQQRWFSANVKDLPIQSISGGTDMIGCFVMGNPIVPAYAGEPQCKGLGFDLRALPIEGAPTLRVGELVCANPFPSRPVGFLGDPDRSCFHDAYFAQNPGLWTHGDLVEFTAEGSVVMHGRSDGTMNIRGIRVGPADIYRVLEGFPEIAEAMAVEQRQEADYGHARIVLLLVLRPGVALDAILEARLRKAIGHQTSAAHVPGLIVQVEALPTTHTGKKSERSARDAVNGAPISNNGSLCNPDCLEAIAAHPGLQDNGTSMMPVQDGIDLLTADGLISEAVLTRLWEQTLGVSDIGRDDDFFDLGGDSLVALRLLLTLETTLGRPLPITFIYGAPTIARMIPQLQTSGLPAFSHLVPIKDGSNDLPFFIIHGLGGNVIELFRLGRMIDYGGPIYAIQASGLDGMSEPLTSVAGMASAYVAAIRAVQSSGPYRLCGYSFGGLIAFEMARQLLAEGDFVEPLILLDTTVDERYWPLGVWIKVIGLIAMKHLRKLATMKPKTIKAYVRDRLDGFQRRLSYRRGTLDGSSLVIEGLDLPVPLLRVREAAIQAVTAYSPEAYGGDIVLVRPAKPDPAAYNAAPLWAKRSRTLTIWEVPGDHRHMVRGPSAAALAEIISTCLGS